jgi:uncharacterized protein involved in exopolysaccharide biosynthesis
MLRAFLVSTVVFSGVALLMPPTYKSQSVLMVRLGQEYLVNADPANTTVFPERREIMSSEVAMLTAPELALRVMQEIGLARIYPGLAADITRGDTASERWAREKALIKFESHLAALPGKDSTLIAVSFSHHNPEIAGLVLARLVDDYLDMRRKHFEYASGDALSLGLSSTTERLEAATRNLNAMRQRAGITDFDAQMAHLFQEKLTLNTAHDQASGDRAAFAAQAASLQQALIRIGPSVPLRTAASDSDALKTARAADAQLHLKENQLMVAMKHGAPQLQDAHLEIALADSLVRSFSREPSLVIETGRPQSYDTIEVALKQAVAALQASEARLADTDARIADVDRATRGLESNRFMLRQLEREQKVAEDAFFQAGKRVTEAVAHDQMMEAAKPNVVVVQAARVPFEETLTRTIIAALGVVLGLLMAGLIAYVDDLGQRRAVPTA